MKEKMRSFLNHIHIENVDDFDLDFEMVGRNRFNYEQIDMIITKETPWNYDLLREFMDALGTIEYPYTLHFSYLQKPTSKDAINLFGDWYRFIYRSEPDIELNESSDSVILVQYLDESFKNRNEEIIKEFKSFLSFISYDFIDINEEIKPAEPEVIEVDEKTKKKALKVASKVAEIDIEENKDEAEPLDRNDIIEMVEKEQSEKNQQMEDAMLKQMKKNREIMLKERERMRLNQRGKYQYIDKIDNITLESDHVDFNGKVYSLEVNERGERKRIVFGVSDEFGGAISCNMYQNLQVNDELVAELLHSNVRIRGVAYVDEYDHNLKIKSHFIDLLPPPEILPDATPIKRVELHLHSNMSTQDGISEMNEYCEYAKKLGHTAMAITDHGCVQGFPDAQKAAKNNDIKMLYGCEFYMVDDKLKYVDNPTDIELNKASYVVFDFETTGLSARYNKIIEFGAVKIVKGAVAQRVDILVNPEVPIPKKIQQITNITESMIKDAPKIEEAIDKIMEFIGDSLLVTHNASFDIAFLNQALIDLGREPIKNGVVDTLTLSQYIFPESRSHRLGVLCRNLEVEYDEKSAHRADYDAFVLSEVWQTLLVRLTKDNLHLKHKDLVNLKAKDELISHLRPKHVIALAKNVEGLKDLYRLVSISNIDYFAKALKMPLLPRRVLEQYRSNLLIGSACFNGEVFENARYYNSYKLKKVMAFYDYIEVQPPENYSFLVNMGELEQEDVYQYIKDIIDAAKEINKPVCATGDVHYCLKEEKIFRDVYISAPQVGKGNHPLNPYSREELPPFENPDQHYRSTEEMIECFSFLEDKDLINEIVITNTNMIADQIDKIIPVPNDHLYTPTIENCENMLKDMCFNRAHELYGDPLPEFIQNRLDTELNGIISNGYSVIYYIAHKLVKKSNEDGYIVGSRGSVGSSFVATMSGITEVNPLPPHYLCPKCKHLEWGKESHPEIRSGFDLPVKKCPICGEIMISDGQDIPFETFLGFHAEKVPDIDLNFPGDYQAQAHEYTKVLLGPENVFRAGTIETVADKTAFGFARGYIERLYMSQGKSKEEAQTLLAAYPKAKLDYLASGCVGVKRTTGQHPGGIVVVPSDHTVYDFTPIQWPADEVGSAWRTTHFDFHSIHDTILKLDMLGHVDPVALKMMCDLTHINIKDIPMNDPEVLALFSKPDSLHLHSNYLNQSTGAMAIPEFGTDFVRGILEKTRPTTFSDLVIISGLSHGTNVWNGNAEQIIDNKTATLQEVIGCRDDIMTYLIGKGLPASVSFSIMEDVRKGRGLKKEYEEAMIAHNVPLYYIDSCKKIKYMFPKGHAVAYVTMAIRVGYFKVHYPLEFYATFFSVRSKQYDIVPMIKGEEAIINRLEQLKVKEKTVGEKLSPKEEEQYKTLQIAVEMTQRGYSFSNIDLYRSDATKFVVDHEHKCLIPPFITIDGLGENNAITVIEERSKRPFTSKEDLLRRTKLTSTNVNDLAALGVLDELSESDQLSLFDFGGF